MSQSELIIYADYNCPFCFALHERMQAVEEQFTWRLIQHAPAVNSDRCSFEEQSELATEVFNVRHRAPEVEIALPPCRPNTELASLWTYQAEIQSLEKAALFRVLVYRALWQHGEDISDIAILTQLAVKAGLDLPVCIANEAEHLALKWQVYWQGADFEERIPVLTRQSQGEQRVSLGLPTFSALMEFIDSGAQSFSSAGICEYKPRQRLVLMSELKRVWSFIESIRNDLDILMVSDHTELDGHLKADTGVDLLLIDVDCHRNALEICQSLRAQPNAQHLPIIFLADQILDEHELVAYEVGVTDYMLMSRPAPVIQAHIFMHLRFKRSLDLLERAARRDGLTQVYNRREFDRILELEWRRAERSRSPLSIVLIDIDHFKQLNDNYGHMFGDDCLKRVAETLTRATRRPADFVSRYGGEEFALILPDSDLQQATQFAEQLRSAVEQLEILPPQSCVEAMETARQTLTISLGVAAKSQLFSGDASHLLSIADIALYRAKALGRNRLCQAEPD